MIQYPELFVVLRGWYEDDNNIFLAMEYFPLGELDGHIARDISEDAARTICAQLLDGLSKMHSIGFTHRDMKPRVNGAAL
jgi:serine/threonine protein kinase